MSKPFADPGDNFPKLERLANSPAVDDLITHAGGTRIRHVNPMRASISMRPSFPRDSNSCHMHTRCVLRRMA